MKITLHTKKSNVTYYIFALTSENTAKYWDTIQQVLFLAFNAFADMETSKKKLEINKKGAEFYKFTKWPEICKATDSQSYIGASTLKNIGFLVISNGGQIQEVEEFYKFFVYLEEESEKALKEVRLVVNNAHFY